MIFCRWCDTEAVKVVSYDSGRRSPACLHCANVFECGQEDFDALIVNLEDIHLVEQDDFTYVETCRHCGAIQKDNSQNFCEACEEEV